MKFSKLVDKFDKLVFKQEKGKRVKPKKLQKLQQLLVDKKSGYEKKLDSTEDPDKRKKLEIKLSVVNAQLEKSYLLQSDHQD
jgi:hypothetical protein